MQKEQKESPRGKSNGQSKKYIPTDNSAAIQRQRLLVAMKAEKSGITTLFARKALDILHPGGRILELRKAGHRIITQWTTEETEAGSLHRVARYVYLGRG